MQTYSRSFAYKVLYNLDRDAAFDLKEANSIDAVGELMNLRLQECQNLNSKEFAERMFDYINADGRLAYYAQMHGWYDYVVEGKNVLIWNLKRTVTEWGLMIFRQPHTGSAE